MIVIIENDFFSNYPAVRIIGTESECNIQKSQGLEVTSYLGAVAFKKAGYKSISGFLDNGFKVYKDVEHIEISTPEALGPRQAAAADLAGILVLSKIVEASGRPHNGLHRHSGTIRDYQSLTSGYHENYLIQNKTTEDLLDSPLIPSHLASRIYSFSGIVGINGFQLSQKIKGIGDEPVSKNRYRRTLHGKKPMAMLPLEDMDTIGDSNWARMEVRYADAGFSPTAKYLSLASTSLVLRLIEHSEKVDITTLENYSFYDPVETARLINNDLTFKNAYETISGEFITALNYQELLAMAASDLSKKVSLPNDELEAIDLWFNICDKLRASDLPKEEYAGLLQLVDFAPRHHYITTRCKPDDINSRNMRTVALNLMWDRILPAGGGMHYWNQTGSEYISQVEIEDLVYNPPASRAALRGMLIREFNDKISAINWAKVTMRGGSKLLMPPDFKV